MFLRPLARSPDLRLETALRLDDLRFLVALLFLDADFRLDETLLLVDRRFLVADLFFDAVLFLVDLRLYIFKDLDILRAESARFLAAALLTMRIPRLRRLAIMRIADLALTRDA